MTVMVDDIRRGYTTMDVATWGIARVFDEVQTMLGIGDFDGDDSDEYQAWRMTQMGRLKRIMKSRHITNWELLMCAEYCRAHRIQPDSHAALLWRYDDAMKWSRAKHSTDLDEEIVSAVAIEQERALSDEEAAQWVDMLLRATGKEREKVLGKWRQLRT